jgi:hypothetical protein
MTQAQTLMTCFYNLESEVTEFAERVQPIFEHNNWFWAGPDPLDSIPTKDEIEAVLFSLIYQARQSAEKSGYHGDCSTGRLCVTINKYENRWHGSLNLQPDSVYVSGRMEVE